MNDDFDDHDDRLPEGFGEFYEELFGRPFVEEEVREFSSSEVRFAVKCLLGVPVAERSAKAAQLYADHPEILEIVCKVLLRRCERVPEVAREDAEFFYRFLEKIPRREKTSWKTRKLLFDEREYYLGELALIAGAACRVLSRREEARRWFDRSEMWLRSVIGLEAGLCRLSYQRLALLTEERRFEEVVEFLPELIADCERRGLAQEVLKCRFLEAAILKETDHLEKAGEVFREIVKGSRVLKAGDRLAATALCALAQLHAELNEPQESIAASREAIPLLRRSGNRVGVAKTHCGLGMLYRRQGNSSAAIETFRAAQMEFEDIQMRADVAALNLIIADLLLEAGQEREALLEIQAALPVIDEYQLVPEGIAALSLLRKSLADHRIDREALRNLHGYFQEREAS